MNLESEKAAIAVVHAFIDTFNAQDHERHAETLNYPHIRLANGRFTRIESAEIFVEISKRGESMLAQEGPQALRIRGRVGRPLDHRPSTIL